MDIQFRCYDKKDCSNIEKIIDDTWEISEYIRDPWTLKNYLSTYFHSYLAESNYTEIAEVNGEIAGFLLGRCNKLSCIRPFLQYKPSNCLTMAELALTQYGRIGLKILHITNRTNSTLIRNHAHEFDGELCLFVVAPKFKGHGIGTQLLNHFHTFMRNNEAANYFVYTDTYSNIGFYEKAGYSLVSSDTVVFEDEDNEPSKYLLYGYNLR